MRTSLEKQGITGAVDIPTSRILDELGIEHILTIHSSPVFSCNDVALVRNIKLSQVLKCMIGKDYNNRVYAMLLSGNKRVCFKKLCLAANGVRISLFSPDELVRKFGFIIGAISPVQLLENTQFYLDESVLSEEFIDISSGSPYAGVMLKTKDLTALINPKICDIAKK